MMPNRNRLASCVAVKAALRSAGSTANFSFLTCFYISRY